MPFASLRLPSLALTRLSSILNRKFANKLLVEVHYLNHDFAEFFGVDLYEEIASGGDHLHTGVGEWFFRRIAFGENEQAAEAYLRRYYGKSPSRILRHRLVARRAALGSWLSDIIAEYNLTANDMVGFTSMFAQSVASFAMARVLKSQAPQILTVIGGANCESVMGRTIAATVPQIDFVCSGPGLRSFPELIERLFEDADSDCRESIPGVFANPNGTRAYLAPFSSAELGEELPLDTAIELDYGPFLDTLESRFTTEKIRPVLLFETSRGCWWGQKAHCTFCGLNGTSMQYRAMSPECALAQFRSLFRFAPRCTEFNCVDNIIPKHYLRDVLPSISAPPGVTLFYEVKADLTDEDVGLLANAKIMTIQPGIEALATSTLKLMRKGTSAFTNLRLLSSCKAHGVVPVWNLLIGFPGEEVSVYQKYLRDLPLLAHFPPPSGAFPVRFDRFSPYFVNATEYGLDLHPLDMYNAAYPHSPGDLEKIAYYFADHRFVAPYQCAMILMRKQLQEAVAHWHERYVGSDGLLPAALHAIDGFNGRTVYDSRDGSLREIALTEHGSALLERLSIPTTLTELTAQASSPREVLSELTQFRELGFLFEEGERLMSVVMRRAPAQTGSPIRNAFS